MRKRSFNIMAFPVGPICNMDCDYCYYNKKYQLYPDEVDFIMSKDTLNNFIKEYINCHSGPTVSFIWQGGEPTLRGLDFYKQVVQLQKKFIPEGWNFENSIQTNGIAIDQKWAEFFQKENFLVGLSIDGPKFLHDKYRKDVDGKSTFKKTINGLNVLQNYNVKINVLCVVNNFNVKYPKKIYEFFKENKVKFIQFIPLITSKQKGKLSRYSIKPKDYGQFLIEIFNLWMLNDYGEIFIQIIEECVKVWFGMTSMMCKLSKKCGDALALEFNGDLYSCDQFVFPENKLGNINSKQLQYMINSNEQINFGKSKFLNLPTQCLDCRFLFICNGGCIKNRLIKTTSNKNLNYLCEGYKLFFEYIEPYINIIINGIKNNQNPILIKKILIERFNR